MKKLILLVIFTLICSPIFAASTDTCFDTDCKLMLPFNGSDGATSTTDSSSSAHTINFVNNAQLSTTSPKFGTAALFLDGTDDGVNAADSADWSNGASDATIDFWVKYGSLTSTNNIQVFYQQCNNTSNFVHFYHKAGADDSIQFTAASGGSTVFNMESSAGSFVPSAGTWYHIAKKRSGSSWTFYVDGSAISGGTFTDSDSWPDIAASLSLGKSDRTNCSSVIDDLNGRLDEFRWVKGTAVTPPSGGPAAEYTACTTARRRISSTVF